MRSTGIAQLTVARVARSAGVSSALVHYHFSTKRKLLLVASARLAARRTTLRLAAFGAGRGLTCLDAIWDNLVAGAAGDAERAWHDLVLLTRQDGELFAALASERERERAGVAAALPRLLADLGSRLRLPVDDLADVIVTFLDGTALALASGVPPREVRVAFDAFWLALVTLGQTAPAR